MKTKILLYVLLIFNFSGFTQDSCVVKVCLNDCLNCYGNFTTIKNIDKSVKKTLVFPSITKKEAETYSKQLLHINDLNKYNVVLSDSLYNSIQNTVTSEIIYYKNNKKIIHENLDKFNPDKIIENKESDIRKIKLPDSILLSQSVTITADENYYQITDYRFGKIVLINKHDTKKIKIITSDDLTTKQIFNTILNNDSSYKIFTKYRNYLVYANFNKTRIEPCRGCRNSLITFITIPDIKIKNNKMTVLSGTGIMEIFNDNRFDLFGYNKKTIPENYYVLTSSVFNFNNLWYLPVVSENKGKTPNNYCLAKFEKKNNMLNFISFVPFDLPSEYNKIKNVLITPTIIYPYLFFTYSTKIYNLEKHKELQLPLTSVKLNIQFDEKNKRVISNEFSYAFSDAVIKNSYLYILYYDTKNKYLLTVDTNTFSKVSLKKIKFKDIKSKSPFYLSDEKHLLYFSEKNEIVIEKMEFEQ